MHNFLEKHNLFRLAPDKLLSLSRPVSREEIRKTVKEFCLTKFPSKKWWAHMVTQGNSKILRNLLITHTCNNIWSVLEHEKGRETSKYFLIK